MKSHLKHSSLGLFVMAMAFASCEKNLDRSASVDMQAHSKAKEGSTASMKGTAFVGLTSSNELVWYKSGNPLWEGSSVSITGLAMNEMIVAIDYRPATGGLMGVSNMSKLYYIDTNTGAATAVSETPFAPPIPMGALVGFDFNPTVDRIRLVTSTGMNLRLNPNMGTGTAITDGNISDMSTDMNSVAYTNSFAGATSTALYDIDVVSDMLFRQTNPNGGTVAAIGPLGVDAMGEGGFDISPDNSVALAVLYGNSDGDDGMNSNKTRFYYINLMTGEATNAGKTDKWIIGLAISPM